jgi:acetyl esterase/lipase
MRIYFSVLFSLILAKAYAQCDTSRYTKTLFSSVTKIANVQYGQAQVWNIPYNNTNLFMDIYVPTGDTVSQRPLLLVAHPGGFLLGDKEADDMVALCDSFARMGWVTASMGYRLGFNPLSASSAVRAVYRGTQDMRAAIRYLKEFATTYGIDTNYTFLGGSSAGAFSTLHTTYLTDAEAPSDIAGGIGYPALGCLDCSGNSYQHNMDITGIFALWGALGDSNYVQANETTPALLIHGEADGTVPIGTGNPFGVFTTPVVNGSRPISNQLTSLGIAHTFLPFAGLDHEFHGADNGAFNTPPNAYWDTIVDAIQDHFYPLLVPNAPIISGPNAVCLGDTVVHHFQGQPGDNFCFELNNGSLINNWGDSIQVQWNTTGQGSITVYAINNIQAFSSKVVHFVSTNALPDASFSFVQNQTLVNFVANQSSQNSTFSWQFDSLGTANTFNPTFDFVNGGLFDVTLTITDSNQCTNSTSQTLMLSQNGAEELNNLDIHVYPIPFDQLLNIETPQGTRIHLLDGMGRILLNVYNENERIQISTEKLGSGIYFLKAISGDKISLTKLIKV